MEAGGPVLAERRKVEAYWVNQGVMSWRKVIQHGFRDAILFPFGAWIIYKQVYAVQPIWWLGAIGFGCMVPAARYAIASIFFGLASSSQSSSQPQLPSSRPTSSGEGHDEKP